jgi:hypothetical protein
MDCAVGILIGFCGCFFNRLDFLLSRRDIRGDGVLGQYDGGGCAIAPLDGVTKLARMILHLLGRTLDGSACGLGGVPGPNMNSIEDCGLMALPSGQRRIDYGENAAQFHRSLAEDVFIGFWPRARSGHLCCVWT